MNWSSNRALRTTGSVKGWFDCVTRIQVPTEGLLTIDDALASEKVQNSIQDKFGFKKIFVETGFRRADPGSDQAYSDQSTELEPSMILKPK